MKPYTVDPKQVISTVGAVNVGGFVDGTFILANRTSDAFSMVSGADNQVTRLKINDSTGTITFTLQQSSPSNSLLTAIGILDEQSGGGIVPITVKDFGGSTLIISPYSWLRKIPEVTYAKEVTSREWVFDCSKIDIFVGDNVGA